MSSSFSLPELDDCEDYLSRTIALASTPHTESKGLLQTPDACKRNEQLQASQHIRQLKRLQKPVSRQTAALPHVLLLLWKACRGGVQVGVSLPPTLLYTAKLPFPAFLWTNQTGVVECMEGQMAFDAFFRSLSKRKASWAIPIAIHHTSIGSASLYFTRKAAMHCLQSCTHSFHYMQKYIDNKTHTPELLCIVWRPFKPAKFFLVLQRRVKQASCDFSKGKERLKSVFEASESWLLNRNDHVKSEILDCAQVDQSVVAQSEQISDLMTTFGIGPVTELISDYMRNKKGKWVFKSIVNVRFEEQQEKPRSRPVTSGEEVPRTMLSLQSKIQNSPPRPRTSLLSSGLAIRGKRELSSGGFESLKKALDVSEVIAKISNLKVPQHPRARIGTLPGQKPIHSKCFSALPSLKNLNISLSKSSPLSPVFTHQPDEYEQKMAKELDVVSSHYDAIQKVVREIHDRKANPRRCVYYYSEGFWSNVAVDLAVKLKEDPKGFPQYYRMDTETLSKLLLSLIKTLKVESLPTPFDPSLLELCVDLSLPRLDSVNFIAYFRRSLKANHMRDDELEVAVSLYQENLQQILNLNWKKSFSSFLKKRVMSAEFMEKVLYLSELKEVCPLQSPESRSP